MVEATINIISYLALAGFFGILVTIWAYLNDTLFGSTLTQRIRTVISPFAYSIAFFLSLSATLASLFLSEVAHFAPCVLCWYQRIFMYTQPVLWYMAMARKQEHIIKPYIMLLNVIGAFWALYHYSLHILPRNLVVIAPCAKSVGGVPCDKGYEMMFGFMTFPLMAAVVFILNIIILQLYTPRVAQAPTKKARKKKK